MTKKMNEKKILIFLIFDILNLNSEGANSIFIPSLNF